MRTACTNAGSPLGLSLHDFAIRIGTPLTALAGSGTPSSRPATAAAALAKIGRGLSSAVQTSTTFPASAIAIASCALPASEWSSMTSNRITFGCRLAR